MKSTLTLLLAALLMTACSESAPEANNTETKSDTPATAAAPEADPAAAKATTVSHEPWTALLQEFVSEEGNVNYEGFKAEETRLQEYLDALRFQGPDASWSDEEVMAYWINAYNAFTIELIVKNYPVNSIMDIKDGETGPWDQSFIKIGMKDYTLNEIEKGILLKEYDEPRIHFAVVCASFSCPKLLNEAFTADKLDDQLGGQAKAFLADEKRNIITADKIQISQLFDWYVGDFTKKGTLMEFLNEYAPIAINDGAEVSYLEYDWSLNK